jgi:glycosyltransferase involved in cell wall biosynthesis
MRICHLAKYYAPFRGGIETHVQTLARSQKAEGHDVTIACINHLDEAGNSSAYRSFARSIRETSEDCGVIVEKFPKYASLARFDLCLGLSNFIRSSASRFDVLHLHVPNPTLCLALARAKPSLPLVIAYHSDIVKQKILRIPFRFIEKKVFAHANRFIAASSAYAKSSPVLLPFGPRVHVIPYGLDLSPYESPSSKAIAFKECLLNKQNGEPLWLCVGRLVYYKGFEFAIRALGSCKGRLMIVGDGPSKDSLKQLANELGVNDRIEWLDGLGSDELVGAYLAATAFWFPSIVRSEAFGLVQVEAMATGCPVINTDIEGSGVPEVSKHQESGLTVAVACPKALADAAMQLVNNPSLRTQLSVGAVARARREFSVERMLCQTTQLYESIVGNEVRAVS